MTRFRFIFLSVLCGFFCLPAFGEDVKISTYYPSPYGNYKHLEIEEASSGSITTFTQSLVNDGLNIKTTYTDGTYAPGIFWSTTNDNATRPKAGIWMMQDSSGSDLYLGTSNSFSTGINKQVVIDQSGNLGVGTVTPLGAIDSRGKNFFGSMGLASGVNAGALISAPGTGGWSDSNAFTSALYLLGSGDGIVSNNYSLYSAGPANSYFRGRVQIASTPSVPAYSLDIQEQQSSIQIKSLDYTKNSFLQIASYAGGLRLGVEQNTGGTLFSGTDSYDAVLGTTDATHSLRFATSGQSRMVIFPSGNVAVGSGTVFPYAKLNVSGGSGNNFSVDALGKIIVNGGWTDKYIVSSHNSTGSGTSMDFYSGDSKKLSMGWGSGGAVVFPNGNVCIGGPQTQFGYPLQVTGNAWKMDGGNNWDHPSDRRLKEDIKPFTDGLPTLRQINPVSFTFNGKGGTHAGSKGISIIAQDIKDLMPYTLSTYKGKLNPEDAETTDIYNFNSSAVTFVLINAVKDLDRENQSLKSELEDLRKRVEALEKHAE